MKEKLVSLPKRYNQRTKWLPSNDADGADIYNLHFIGKAKPWRPLTMEGLKWFVKNNYYTPIYFEAWLRYASQIRGFDTFCKVKTWDTKKSIGVYSAFAAGL